MFGGGQYAGQGGQGGAGQNQQYYQQQQQPQQQQQQQQQRMQMQMQMQGMLAGSPSSFAGGLGAPPMTPFAAGGQPVSTSGLLQQQLAQQAAAAAAAQNYQAAQQMQGAGRPVPYPNQQPFPPNSSAGYTQPPYVPQSRPPTAYPTATSAQASPPVAVAATLTPRSGTQSMSHQDIQAALRGVSLQGMTAERFAQLAPHQQAALRELMARQRAQQQQSQSGLGPPGAGPQATPLRAPPAAAPAPSPLAPNRPQGASSAAPAPSAPPSAPQLAFLKTLADFYAKRGQPFAGPPTIEGRVLDLARMFAAVQQCGGSAAVAANNRWGYVASSLGFAAQSPDAHPQDRLAVLEQAYQRALLPFEQYWQQIQRARQAAGPANAASPNASAISPAGNGAVGSPAQAPFAGPSPAAPLMTNGAPKQTIQARRIERAATEAQNQLQASSRQAQTEQSPRLPVSNIFNDSPNIPNRSTSRASSSTGVATPRQSHSRPRTATSAAPPFAGATPGPTNADNASENVKPEEIAESTASTSALPSSRPSSSSGPRAAQRTKSGISSSNGVPEPVKAAAPARRKRRRIEYRPYAKVAEPFGGIEQADQVLNAAERVRQPRQVGDLGLVDVHALTMSLRCRIPSEVAYALNALALIALQISGDGPSAPGVQFPLEQCPELLEELLDLLEETAFGYGDEPRSPSRNDGVGTTAQNARAPQATLEYAEALRSYRHLFRRVEAEMSELVGPSEATPTATELGNSLRPGPTILAICNVLRNLTVSERNMRFAAQEPRLADVLIRITALPMRSSSSSSALSVTTVSPYPVRLSAYDLLTVRKTVIEILSHIALDVSLEGYPATVAAKAVELVLFFLRDAEHHKEPFAMGLSSSLPSLNRIPQPHAKVGLQSPTVLPYLGHGLATCARLFLRDGNRSAVSDLIEPDELYETFVSLVALLPIAEKDFQVMTYEIGLLYMHSVVVSLYNLAFLAPPSVKAQLQRHPSITRAFLRMVRRLAGTQVAYSDEDIYLQVAHRALAILQMLDGGGAARASGRKAAVTGSSDLPWYGMSMSGVDEEDSGDDAPTEAEPPLTSVDISSVDDEDAVMKATATATGTAAPASTNDKAPILAGEVRQLLEHLSQGMMPLVIPTLIGLASSAGPNGTRKRR
ncbi:hypothetical protein JCM3774_004736 [Rhodotorula dairenensis]